MSLFAIIASGLFSNYPMWFDKNNIKHFMTDFPIYFFVKFLAPKEGFIVHVLRGLICYIFNFELPCKLIHRLVPGQKNLIIASL